MDTTGILDRLTDAMTVTDTKPAPAIQKPTNGRGSEEWFERMDRLADADIQRLARKMERVHATPEEMAELRRIRRSQRNKARKA